MASATKELNNFYESFITQALERTDKSVAIWSKYRNDLEVTKSLLTLISKKVTNNVMVPISPKALMPGKIVHTNEFLVNLGETWFVKRSAHQTIEICDRRIKTCAEMLEKLGKERELIVNKATLPVEQEAFGNEERREIIEYMTDEDYEKFKEQHRVVEKQYKQKLAELRKKEKTSSETMDIWTHLDQLELQEELENELSRLNCEHSNINVSEKNSQCSTSCLEGDQDLEKNLKEENLISESKSMKNVDVKRKVSFACDFDSSDDEPLRLEIKHSDVTPISCTPNSKEINSPSDIYNHYKNLINKKPVSVLKQSVYNNEQNYLDLIKNDKVLDIDEEEALEEYSTISLGVKLHDILEKNVSDIDYVQKTIDSKSKKISKFKASRKKCS